MNNKYLYEKFKISKIVIPEEIIFDTEKYLREYGQRHHEGMVFWLGRKHKDTAYIASCINPVQTSTAVTVDIALAESQRINRILASKKEVLIAQVHSHPNTAFHSSRDDSMPATYAIGYFSLVVPYFCKNGMGNMSEIVIVEYIGSGEWKKLKNNEIAKRFEIVNS